MTTTNEIERVILNLEDRIAQLQAELAERDATIVRLKKELTDCLAGMDADALIISQAGRDIAKRDATIARLREALERIAMCPTDGCDGLVLLAKTALAEQPSPAEQHICDGKIVPGRWEDCVHREHIYGAGKS